MTDGVVPVCNLAVNTGANIPVPVIQFEEDATYGTQIRRIKLGDIVFNFADTPMFGVGLWDAGNELYYELTDEEWEPTIETDAGTHVITITLGLAAPYSGIEFVCQLTPISEGYQVSAVAMNNDNATYSVEWFEFPRLACQAPSGTAGNAYLAHGFVGGMVIKDPHLYTLTDATRNALSSPPNMQYLSYWDVTTKEHLYLATDDEDGCTKHTMIQGDGSSVTVISHRHWFPNPRRAGNAGVVPYTVPYNVNIELFKGRTEDGRCGFYDAAIRYRCWGTHGDRAWVAGGAWTASPTISDRVKNSDAYYVSATSYSASNPQPWTDIVEDMMRIKTIIGADEMLGLLYSWAENINFIQDFEPPAFTPLIEGSDQNTAIGVANAANLHLSYYTLPAFWETTLSGSSTPFDFDEFIGNINYGPVLNYIIRDVDGDPYNPDLTPAGPVYPDAPTIPPIFVP